MALAAGTKLGPYEIQAPLAAGGIGEVYRAVTRGWIELWRSNFLASAMAGDADRPRRFEQEARTIAALNHPNILGIDDLGTYNGAPFLVGEFPEGVTLREKYSENSKTYVYDTRRILGTLYVAGGSQ